MKQATRRVLLFSLLAATVLTAIWPYPEQRENVPLRRQRLDPSAVPPAPYAGPGPDMGHTTTPAVRNRFDGEAVITDPFGIRNWAPPPPPSPAPRPGGPGATLPTAPPLPFTYAGKLEVEHGRWTVYLERGEQTFAVNKGDVFDGVYRFDGEESGSLLIQYLPLSVTQKLQLSKEN